MTSPSRVLTAALLLLPASLSHADDKIALSPEDRAKLETYNAFRAGIDDFLPSVNLIDPAALPVTFAYRDVMAHVVVDLSFGGETALPFMLDTGAPTLVTDDLLEEWGGEIVFESPGLAGGGALVWNPTALIPSANVQGVLPIESLTAAGGWDGTGAFYCITPHGLLGASAMRNAVWQLDYGAGEVTVAASVD